MKLWSVTIFPVGKSFPCLASIGLLVLAAIQASYVLAEEASKPVAAAPAKHESPASKPGKAANQAKPEDHAAKPAQTVKAKSKSATPLASAECVRTGQRVIAALARDDSGAASQFHTFYTAFKCSPQHLALAFGCLVNLQKANPGLSNPSAEQITQCWDEPNEIPMNQVQPGSEGVSDKH